MMKVLRLSTISLALLLVFLFAPRIASAQGEGVIEGSIVNGSSGGEKVGGITVTLHVLKGAESKEGRQATADEAGKFSFSGLDTASDYIYWVSAEYKDVEYMSEDISLSSEAKKVIEIIVYEKMADASAIRLEQANLVVMSVEQAGVLQVLEVILVNNASDRTYVAEGGGETLRLPLAAQAYDFVLGHGFGTGSVFPVEGGFAIADPVLPGESQLIFAYKVNYSATKYNLSKSFLYPLGEFWLFVPEGGLGVESNQLVSAGSTQLDSTRFQVFTGGDISPGSPLAITFSGLPRTGQPWISGLSNLQKGLMLSFALLAAGAIVAYIYFVRRRRPAMVAEGVAQAEGNLEDERKSLLESIARLDDEFEAGTISEKEYQERRALEKKRLQEVLRRLRGGESS